MVFRKPYAFIIKHFRLIHLILLGCLLFICLSLNDIHNLFQTLQGSNTLMYSGASIYVNNIVYVFIVIMLGLTGIVYWLLKEKKKPTMAYLLLLIYLVVLLFVYMYLYPLLTSIIDELTDLDTIIFAKDITMIATLPSYIFIVICFIRGIGFNLKKFNFSKDIKELQIDEKDSEEIELTLGHNNYKYMRFIRRTIREAKYYILENKFAIMCISSLLLVVLAIWGINYYNEYKKVLSAQEATSVNGITYTIRNSYVTTEDTNGNVVREGYKYIVLDMSFYNSTSSNKAIDLDLITLANGKISYSPITTKNEKFFDLGYAYPVGDVIKADETMDATIAFELPKDASTSNLKLRIRYAVENKVSSVIARYRMFDVSPKNIDTKDNTINVNLNETMNINPAGVNKYNLSINSYKLTDIYDNKYILCSSLEKCYPLSSVISPSQKEKYTMLELDYDSTIYEGNKFSETLNTNNKIFENYVTVNYTLVNKTYSVKAQVASSNEVDNKVFLLVDRKILNADSIELVFNFRNDTYRLMLYES